MQLPGWNDPALQAGTMIKIALWLVTEVGIGNSFTKDQLRMAFPGVAQADRRVRDLRAYGWVIHTSLEDLTLNPNEQRLAHVGLPVWDKAIRRAASATSISSKRRKSVLAANDFLCSACGIAGGECYPDEPQRRAVLSLTRCDLCVGGTQSVALIPECDRCRAGGGSFYDVSKLLDELKSLDSTDGDMFLRWASTGGRRGTLERAWSQFRRLPEDVKSKVLQQFRNESLTGV